MTTGHADTPRPGDAEQPAAGTAVDTALFETIGLSKILRPPAGASAAHRLSATARLICWLAVGPQVVQTVLLFRSRDRGMQLVYEAVVVVNVLLSTYKGVVVMAHADELRDVLRVADHGFTRCSRRRPSEMRRTGAALSAWLRTFFGLAYGSLILWSVALWLGGTAGPPGAARAAWVAWSAVYTVSLFVALYCVTVYDCCLITACLALDAQFRTASASCATVGHRRPTPAAAFSSPHLCPARPGGAGTRPKPGSRTRHAFDRLAQFGRLVSSEQEYNCENSGNTRSEDPYDELIHHINDMQKITKKLDDFYAIVRPVTVVQVIISCLTIITFLFFTVQMYLMGWSIASTTVLRFLFGLWSFIFELFMHCYAFHKVDTARSALNFGLYSCNWTEMDLEFQKTILLTMRMNSAHNKVMRITPNKDVNLELFGKVIGLSYRIVSVLINK